MRTIAIVEMEAVLKFKKITVIKAVKKYIDMFYQLKCDISVYIRHMF